MIKRISSFVLMTLFMTGAAAFAHEHKLMGTVTMAAADHVMMKTIDGNDVTVKITSETKITKGKATVKADAITKGTRLVVTTASDENPYTAMAIQVGAAAKTTQKK